MHQASSHEVTLDDAVQAQLVRLVKEFFPKFFCFLSKTIIAATSSKNHWKQH